MNKEINKYVARFLFIQACASKQLVHGKFGFTASGEGINTPYYRGDLFISEDKMIQFSCSESKIRIWLNYDMINRQLDCEKPYPFKGYKIVSFEYFMSQYSKAYPDFSKLMLFNMDEFE